MEKLSEKYYRLTVCLLLGTVILLSSSCGSMTSTSSIAVDVAEHWALLPMKNLSDTADADAQALNIIETRLRTRGIGSIDTYAPMQRVSLRQLLDTDEELQQSQEWARRSGFRYGLTGTILEWQYKSGADREPSVGLSLKLIDLSTNKVVWQANAARTGWGYSSLPGVADSVIKKMLKNVRLVTAS